MAETIEKFNEWYKLNVNDTVRVKLTDYGLAHLRREHDELNKLFNGLMGDYVPPVQDEDGYCDFQLWDLMYKMGPLLRMGGSAPFETTIEINADSLKR